MIKKNIFCKYVFIQARVLADNGGTDLTDFVRRCMKFMFSPELAKQFNLTGQNNKFCFQSLPHYTIMFSK